MAQIHLNLMYSFYTIFIVYLTIIGDQKMFILITVLNNNYQITE